MFPPELIALIKHLVTSKEVIGVTIFLVLYFSLVFYVTRNRRRKKKSSLVLPINKPKKSKVERTPASEIIDEDDELGLEDG
jgi:hypothetical protein